MTTNKQLSKKYQKLCRDLRTLMEQARAEAHGVLMQIRNRTYWAMGERLSKEREIKQGTSASQFLKSLAMEIGVTPTVLWRAVKFHAAYPDGLPSAAGGPGALSWAMHVELLPVSDQAARKFYLEKSASQGWSARKLRRAIKNKMYEESAGRGPGSSPALDRPSSGLHTYAGRVERVIDGDTILVRIDLGFGVWKSERIRLRGVDAPELSTPGGKTSKKYVDAIFKELSQVVVKTYKTDIYARYVADLFFDPALEDKGAIFEKGRFLNQELLEKNLAVKMLY